MLDIAFFILVGALIGWQVPQPFWAKKLTDFIINFIKNKSK